MDAAQGKTTVIEAARANGIQLEPGDVDGAPGAFTIDGMPWAEWLDAMTD